MASTLRQRLYKIALRNPALGRRLATGSPVTTNWKRVIALDKGDYPVTGYVRNLSTPQSALLGSEVELRNVNEFGGRSGRGRVVAVISTTDGGSPSPSLPEPERDLVSVFKQIRFGDQIRIFPSSRVSFKVTNVGPNEVNFKMRSLAEGQLRIDPSKPQFVLLTQGSRTVPLRRLEITR